MPAASSRALWKGAISFGLVHIPVALYSATADSGIDFDWIDRRSMDPVGYQRINKKTGKPIDKDDIVKGIEQENGSYVVLSEDEIAGAYPRSTQTIDIEAFVPATDIPFVYLERPYYLAPAAKGSKVYALLRETLAKKQLIGIARFVLHSKQHLAALVPSGPALVLNTLRWEAEVRTLEGLDLPPEGVRQAGVSAKEIEMAGRLVDDMSGAWKPADYTDSFRDRILALVQEKRDAGKLEDVSRPGEEPREGESAEIIDLTELLQRSLRRGGGGAASTKPAAKSSAKTAAKKKASTGSSASAKKAPAKSASRSSAAKAPARKRA